MPPLRAGLAALRLASTLVVAGCAGHPGPPPSTAIDENGFRNAVSRLASDEFGGRRPGTAGADKTVGYLIEQFKKIGLKPGNGDSFVQAVPLVETVAGEDASLSLAGHGRVLTLAYAKDMVIWTRRESPDASLQQSELVFVGYGIVAPEYQWNDYSQTDVHGKTVVVLVNDPGYGSKDPRVFRGNAQTAYGQWSYKVAEAARQGAAGVLLLHDDAAAGFGWNIVVNDRTGPQFDRVTAGGEPRVAVEGWLSAASARALFAQAGLDLTTLSGDAAKPGFKPVPLGIKIDAAVHASVRHLSSENVVAILPGRGRKNEYVVYSAHWDHLGRQRSGQGEGVFGGAVEDASGVAGLLMLAQSWSRTRPAPERSMVFIAFTGAEAGLLGSAHYLENPTFPLRQTVADLNLDMLRIGGPTRDVMVIGFGNSELEEFLRDAALLEGKEVHPDPTPEQALFYRSDQFSFARNGIPALYARGGIDDSARGPVWGQAQLEDYMAHRYHQVADKYSADWDVRGTLYDLGLYYEIGSRLAQTRRFPRWYPTSEFRAGHRHPRAAASAPDAGE